MAETLPEEGEGLSVGDGVSSFPLLLRKRNIGQKEGRWEPQYLAASRVDTDGGVRGAPSPPSRGHHRPSAHAEPRRGPPRTPPGTVTSPGGMTEGQRMQAGGAEPDRGRDQPMRRQQSGWARQRRNRAPTPARVRRGALPQPAAIAAVPAAPRQDPAVVSWR